MNYAPVERRRKRMRKVRIKKINDEVTNPKSSWNEVSPQGIQRRFG